MRGATCFSGIGAPEIALPEIDWVWHSEIEPFPCAVMAARHPENENLGDILAADFIERAKARGPLDIVIGGPPCQAFSIAGLRGSLSDPRGNLSLRYVQVLHAIRPRVAVTENVPGWLSTGDNAFGCFLAGVVGADAPLVSPLERGRWPNHGMVSGPLARAAWRVLDAQFVRTRTFPWAVPQRRRRVFVVISFGAGGPDPAAVLFDRESLRGNPAPRREAGQGTSADVGGGPDGGSIAGTVSSKWAKGSGGPAGDECYNMIAHTLRGEGFDASEDGTGRGTPLVPVQQPFSIMPMNSGKDYKARETDVAQPIMAGGPVGGNQGGDIVVGAVCGGSDPITTDGSTIFPLTTRHGDQTAIAFDMRGREGGAMPEGPHDTANIRAASGGSSRSYVAQTWCVRRLTPRECERLQAFPDDFTRIAWRGKPADKCPDGPRYKALGNSMAVNVMAWIGERIAAVEAISEQQRRAA